MQRGLPERSSAQLGSTMSTDAPLKPLPWHERLSSQKVGKRSGEKTADDAIVTNLSVDSLRWIRKHRKADCNEKVPLSYAHERQLREIFQGLDLTDSGIIDLGALQAAAEYVEKSTKGKVGELKNILSMFESMDEDGNGEIDFHEFTTAMTGSSRSAMNVMSADDIERMQRLFVDFASMRRREFAVKTIDAVWLVTCSHRSMTLTLTHILFLSTVGKAALA